MSSHEDLLEKLSGIEDRYAELDDQLMRVGDDYQRAADLGIERAEIEPIVQKAVLYRQLLDQLKTQVHL